MLSVASSMFISGDPMKLATKVFAGALYSFDGVSNCWMRPSFPHADALAHRHRLDPVVRHVMTVQG